MDSHKLCLFCNLSPNLQLLSPYTVMAFQKQTCAFAYTYLISKPYKNEGTLTGDIRP